MDNYKLHQIIASVCVALFIVTGAVCILCYDRSIYGKCYTNYQALMNSEAIEEEYGLISEFEAKLNYEGLADDFSSFFNGNYNLTGYELSDANEESLKELKIYYRLAWIVMLISAGFGIKSFIFLSKRRLYMPLIYGGTLAGLLTVVNTLFMIGAKGGILYSIKSMIFREDYSFFSGKDILVGIIPPDFARMLFLAYILIVFLLIALMALIRSIIIFCGRPHRF